MKPEGYPTIHASRTGDERFGWSVEVLVNGLLHPPRLAASSHTCGESMTSTLTEPFWAFTEQCSLRPKFIAPASVASR
jgi:hypothetical protein